jgi:hypothetical protein
MLDEGEVDHRRCAAHRDAARLRTGRSPGDTKSGAGGHDRSARRRRRHGRPGQASTVQRQSISKPMRRLVVSSLTSSNTNGNCRSSALLNSASTSTLIVFLISRSDPGDVNGPPSGLPICSPSTMTNGHYEWLSPHETMRGPELPFNAHLHNA